ncbi:MAG: hypothetical protein KUG77_01730 [Nannocystaceae bacterium]|nr:hypothetical protein [Nannocystaceae bacterium]
MRTRDRLAELYPAPPPADPKVRDALERALLEKLPPRRRWAWRRRMLAGGLVGLAFAGACVIPTDYSMDFGHRLAFSVDDNAFDPRALSEHIRTRFEGVEELRISATKSMVERDDGSTARLQFDVVLDVVGSPDPDAIEVSLLEHFDALTPTDIDIDALDETVHGTLGGMLSHRTLGWVLDGESAQQARARILANFAAQGLPPPSRVDVQIEDHQGHGRHEREIRVEIEAGDAPPG